MALNIKQLLNESMPHDLTFSEREKQQVRETVFTKKPTTFIRILPLAAVLLVSLVGYLLYSTYSDSQPAEVTWHEEIIIPNTFETSLNRSIYIPDQHEIVYSKEDGFYSFSINERIETKIETFTDSLGQYEYAVNEDWLVWGDFVNDTYTLIIVNRQTHEVEEIPSILPTNLTLEQDTLYYVNFMDPEDSIVAMDLDTMIGRNLHTTTFDDVEGARESFGDGKAVVAETRKDLTTFYVYDALTGSLMQKIEGNYPSIYNMYMNQERVYIDFATDEGRLELAYLDIQTGTITNIETPEYSFSTVHENYVALSVIEDWGAETDDVELFILEGNTVKPLTTFPDVKDRLVTPQFFEDGILRMVEENYSDGGPTLHLVKP